MQTSLPSSLFIRFQLPFYMPTLALSNSVAYSALSDAGMDTVKAFPPIRVFGTIGFILTMWLVDILGFQSNQNQFITSGVVSILLFLYTFTLPKCAVNKGTEQKEFLWMPLAYVLSPYSRRRRWQSSLSSQCYWV